MNYEELFLEMCNTERHLREEEQRFRDVDITEKIYTGWKNDEKMSQLISYHNMYNYDYEVGE